MEIAAVHAPRDGARQALQKHYVDSMARSYGARWNPRGCCAAPRGNSSARASIASPGGRDRRIPRERGAGRLEWRERGEETVEEAEGDQAENGDGAEVAPPAKVTAHIPTNRLACEHPKAHNGRTNHRGGGAFRGRKGVSQDR